ncbi:MAG TPA: 4-alpha-glucanotransferase [Candidatus Baltobacteraceae bacterium]|jgi:4-alpha-glucanotransferase|nr:4-alpha-glucanotransferase [Candidatus Baltobacteraceae bacterium]
MNESLERLATLAGIEPRYYDYWGRLVETPDSTKRSLLAAMGYAASDDDAIAATLHELERERRERLLPAAAVVEAGVAPEVVAKLSDARWTIELEDGSAYRGPLTKLPLGYHRLTASDSRRESVCRLIVVPGRCYLPPAMEDGRVWALSTQLYALRSKRDWGIGDFGDLAAFSAHAGSAGASAVGLNPLHALYPSNPTSASPYSPSSRLFLNVLYIDVEGVLEQGSSPEVRALAESAEFRARAAALRDASLVNYRGVASLKLEVLALLHRLFRASRERDPGSSPAVEFALFVERGGEALYRLAVYEALSEALRARDSSLYGWQSWPAEFRSADSVAVSEFARAHAERVEFFLYLQWLAEQQLGEAFVAARAGGVAFYRDLAVGSDLGGADAWGDRVAFITQASLGAPGDMHNDAGQFWGLAPLSPRGLCEQGYAPLAALLRANMRYASILRIDHVMALQRAFWIPRGASALEGAYVRYPLEEMLGVVALESLRQQCAVVGEDLGTVPEGFRERVQSANVLSSRVLYFERNWSNGSFLSPERYPRLAAASVGTHDLPTLAGWWTGDRSDGEDRARDRYLLVDAFERAGEICASGMPALYAAGVTGDAGVVPEVVDGATRFLAGTPSALTVVAIEDVLCEREAVNVPGTVDEHPNWQRKRSLPLEALASDGRLARTGRIIEEARSQTVLSVGR